MSAVQALFVGTGSDATLTCPTAAESEDENVSWLKGDIGSLTAVDVHNDSRISTANNDLTISDFQNSQHGGSYYCLVDDGQGHRHLSCPLHLQHASEPDTHSNRITWSTFPQSYSIKHHPFTHCTHSLRNNGAYIFASCE